MLTKSVKKIYFYKMLTFISAGISAQTFEVKGTQGWLLYK